MKRVAVIGAGISGLSAAFYLDRRRRDGAALRIDVLEASDRAGGVVLTEKVDGCVVEAGPDSFLTEKPWALALCRDLGIEDEVIGSNDPDRKTYIVVNGRLVPIPAGLQFMVPTRISPVLTSRLFSFTTKLRMAAELFSRPRPGGGDESVAEMVARHYGREMVERLADPLLAGVYGGEASRLSVRAVLPRFAEMEARTGSLGRGMIAARKNRRAAAGGNPSPPSAAPPPLFSSLRDGMQRMIDAILGRLPEGTIHTNTSVLSIRRAKGRWSLSLGQAGSEIFDAVIVALPATAAATLLPGLDGELARELGRISYSSSVTVGLGYDRSVSASLPSGFGFLVPRSEGKRLIACTFVHNKFPHRTSPERILLRAFLGGSRDGGIHDSSDEDILLTVREELREILGLDASPRFARIHRWPSAMAQYEPGHLERVKSIERLRRRHPGLLLAGNAYRGIGVPDCIRSGMEAAAEIAGESA